jgi:leucyl-tRNA synthetase
MTEEKFNVGKEAYTGDGTMINSGFLNGLSANKAKATATYRLEELAIGNRKINYRLRDWGISRQRYWGCPIPIIYCDDCGSVPVPDDQLPVELPKDVSFDKLGNPLDHHPTWKHIDCPSCGKAATRETDTFDTFFESSWYFARFCSPDADNGLDKSACNKWLPVDQYIGGIEHAVLHLLYARFFTRALNKCGYIDVKEPFTRLLTQGMVCHETYQNKDGKWLFPDDVIKQDGKYTHIKTGEEVIVGRTQKMSKSKKNVVDPLEIIQSYGADTARLFMLSDSPPERDLEWSDSGIDGAWRFVNRLWRLGENIKDKIAGLTDDYSSVSDKEAVKLRKIVHKTVAAITSDLDNFYLNKSVARVRELTNAIEAIKLENEDCKLALKESVEILVRLILPMIPHIAEELWESLGFSGNVNQWPVADKDLLIDNVVTIAVQHNGKLRGTLELPVNISREEAEKAALELPSIQKILAEKELRKIIVVQNKIVNVVA